jgi:hypothetical protein
MLGGVCAGLVWTLGALEAPVIMPNSSSKCDALQHSNATDRAGVARRGQAQGGCGGLVHPHSVIRGCKLQDGGEVEAINDWLSFTLPCGHDSPKQLADDFLSGFPLNYSPRDYGKYHYSHGFDLHGGGFVLYHPSRPEMGVHVSLPSGSLAALDMPVAALIQMVKEWGGMFKRLDLAVDSYSVTMATVKEAWSQGNVVKYGTQSKIIQNFKDDDDGIPQPVGETLSIGSRSSDAYVRIYDKAAQQGEDGIHTRCEVELKDRKAEAAAAVILGGADLLGLIVSVIDFRDRGADSNVSRCPRLDWWDEWVGSVKRVRFSVTKVLVVTVERVFEWVRKQVAPSLAFLDKYFEHDGVPNYRWLWDLCQANERRIKPEMRLLLQGG